MSEKFQLTYHVDDGYVGNAPQYLTLNADDLEEDMSDDAVEELLDDEVQADFEQTVTPYVKDEERLRFVLWAREQIAKINEDGEEGFTVHELGMVLSIVLWASIVVAVICTIVHFIHKYW